MSSAETAISVHNLSKAYTIAHNSAKHTTLAEAMMHWMRHPFVRRRRETFWALRDLSLEIKKGEVVGVIGRNGAGKSTLLKILSRITEPTQGKIELYGRIGSLLEVGTGFHPELTGRENIYLNGQILGMRKREIDSQFDAIVEFADMEKFLDTPVKRYSSGMYVRLAFAVAAHLTSEILVVDEVLAVGDSEFQRKCIGKMSDVARVGRTVLFVSHNMPAVMHLCSRCILLSKGLIAFDGDTGAAVSQYLQTVKAASLRARLVNSERASADYGRRVRLTAARAIPDNGRSFAWWEPLKFEICAAKLGSAEDVYFGVGIETADGSRITTAETNSPACLIPGQSEFQLRVTIGDVGLAPGTYTLAIGCRSGLQDLDYVANALRFEVSELSGDGDRLYKGRHGFGPISCRATWELGQSAQANCAGIDYVEQ